MDHRPFTLLALMLVLSLGTAGSFAQDSPAAGTIVVVGDSTALQLVDAAADAFARTGDAGRVSTIATRDDVSIFCDDHHDIDLFASRTPLSAPAQAECARSLADIRAFRLGYEYAGVYVSSENDFLFDLTREQLRMLFTSAERWNQIDPSFPDEPIGFTLATDSAAYDLLVERVLDGDHTAVERAPGMWFGGDTLADRVAGLLGDPNWVTVMSGVEAASLSSALRLISIDGAAPTAESAHTDAYPMARSLLLYVNPTSVSDQPHVLRFLSFLTDHTSTAAVSLGYLPPSVEDQAHNNRQWASMESSAD